MDESIQPGSKIPGYILNNKIGQGSFSNVYKATHIVTQVDCAIKIISKSSLTDQQAKQLVDNEIAIMKELDHPFIIQFYESFEDDNNIYISMEYAENGSVYSYIKKNGKFDECSSRELFCEILSAMDYLHNNLKIAHRDIKAENILLDKNNHIRLIDFGFSKKFDDQAKSFSNACGSPAYAAPEILKGNLHGPSSDIWSLGVVLYVLLSGTLPFTDENMQRLLQKIIYTEPKYMTDSFNAQTKDLVQKMLKKDSKYRLTLSGIYKNLWVRKHPQIELLTKDLGSTKLRNYPIDQSVFPDFDSTILSENNEDETSDAFIKYRIYKRQKVRQEINTIIVKKEKTIFSENTNDNGNAHTTIPPKAESDTANNVILTKPQIPKPPNLKLSRPVNVVNQKVNEPHSSSTKAIPNSAMTNTNSPRSSRTIPRDLTKKNSDPYFNVKRHKTGSFLDIMKK